MLPSQKTTASQVGSAYDYRFNNLLTGAEMPLFSFKGKVILVVNTASKCGFTKQYSALEELYQKYKDQGLVILGVPSNDFGAQEPGTSEEIAKFCQINYGVTFPMTTKQIVSGDNAHDFYKWAGETLGFISKPKWNFHKYIISRDGRLVDYFVSNTEPNSEKLENKVKELLAEKVKE